MTTITSKHGWGAKLEWALDCVRSVKTDPTYCSAMLVCFRALTSCDCSPSKPNSGDEGCCLGSGGRYPALPCCKGPFDVSLRDGNPKILCPVVSILCPNSLVPFVGLTPSPLPSSKNPPKGSVGVPTTGLGDRESDSWARDVKIENAVTLCDLGRFAPGRNEQCRTPSVCGAETSVWPHSKE